MADNKYANGKIYKLVSKNLEHTEFYVGSTITELRKRLYKHKHDAVKYPTYKVYDYFNKVGWNNVSIILIENHPCNNVDELKRRERFWIEKDKPTLNMTIPLRTDQEYYQDNKEKIKERVRQYVEENKEKVKQRRKEYTEKHKEQNRQRAKEHYEKNKTVNVECECGCVVRKRWLKEHKKSKQHTERMLQKVQD